MNCRHIIFDPLFLPRACRHCGRPLKISLNISSGLALSLKNRPFFATLLLIIIGQTVYQQFPPQNTILNLENFRFLSTNNPFLTLETSVALKKNQVSKNILLVGGSNNNDYKLEINVQYTILILLRLILLSHFLVKYFQFGMSFHLHAATCGQFHQHSMSSFYARRSRKRKKAARLGSLICAFGICECKSCS